MDKYSVVIDNETISYWKFLLISKLYDEQKIDCFYILNKKQNSLRLSFKRFACKGLSLITTSEIFYEVPKIYISETSQFNGNLIWLSEEKINFEYNNDLYFFADTSGNQKTEFSIIDATDLEAVTATYLYKVKKSTSTKINSSWTESAKFSKNKTITMHLSSLRYLFNDSKNQNPYDFPNFNTKGKAERSSSIANVVKKIYFLLFYYTSWSLYKYPRVLNIFDDNKLITNKVSKIFNDKTWDFSADPFYSESENSLYFEKFNYLFGIGKLSKYSFDTSEIIEIKTKDNFHLSYPCLFEYKNKTYVIPEGAQSNKIVIYELINGKDLISVNTVAENFSGIDPTIVESNGIWYIFATDGSKGSNSYLNIFYSNSPLEKWNQHELNPVKINITNARGAGSIFKEGNSLIRPAQNCYPEYGTSIVFNKIETLSPSEFRESVVGSVIPPKNSHFKGIHTFSKNKDSYIVDLKTNEYFPLARLVTLLRARIKSNDEGVFLENSLFKRITFVFLILIFIFLIYLFGWQALSLFV